MEAGQDRGQLERFERFLLAFPESMYALLRLTVKDPRRGGTDIPKAVEPAPVDGAPVASAPLRGDAARGIREALGIAGDPDFIADQGTTPVSRRGRGGFEVRTSATVRALGRTPSGWALTVGPTPHPAHSAFTKESLL